MEEDAPAPALPPAASQATATTAVDAPPPAAQQLKMEAHPTTAEAPALESATDTAGAEMKKEDPDAATGQAADGKGAEAKEEPGAADMNAAPLSTVLPLPPTAELLEEACGWTVNGQIEVC